MYNFLRTTSGVMIVVAIIAFIVLLVDSVGAQQRVQKAAKQGTTMIKKKPIVRIVALLVTIAMVAGAVITDRVAAALKDNETISKPNSFDGTSVTQPTIPSKYEEMRSEIVLYLDKHNDTSKMYKNVEVKYDIEKVRFNIEVQSYETYTFASIVNAATTAVEKIVDENDIEDYCLWVYSPTDAKYKLSWISFNLKSGILDDKGYTEDYNETIRLEKMLKRYGYEDYEGSLSDFLNSRDS